MTPIYGIADAIIDNELQIQKLKDAVSNRSNIPAKVCNLVKGVLNTLDRQRELINEQNKQPRRA